MKLGIEDLVDEDMRGILLPPVEGGSGTYGSRGRFIDWLMGDRKIRALARKEVDELVLKSQQGGRDVPADPPPTQLPPPVSASTETKGGRTSRAARPRQAR